jgi:flagellar hook-length control protein FliK
MRDAIETAMPRLREMMADSGISLGQTAVSASRFTGRHPGRPVPERTAGGAADTRAGPHPVQTPASRTGIGMVDILRDAP